MSNPIFCEKLKKNYFKVSSAEIFQSMLSVNDL